MTRDAAIRAVRLQIVRERAAKKRDAAAASLLPAGEEEEIENAIALSLAGSAPPAQPATRPRASRSPLSPEQQRAIIFDECIELYLAATERCRAYLLCVWCCPASSSSCPTSLALRVADLRPPPSHPLPAQRRAARSYTRWMRFMQQSGVSPAYRDPTDVSEGNEPLRQALRSKLLPVACVGRIALSDDDGDDDESSGYNDNESSNDFDNPD
jgi:hypothetical protein